MKRRPRNTQTEAPTARPESRLGGIPVISHDDDERPSREDMTYGETIFNRGVVPLPRFLTGRKKMAGRASRRAGRA